MIVVHATLPVKPEARDAFLGAVGGLVEASNAEPGVLSYACHEAVGAPNTFVFIETYVDKAAFDAHLTSPHFAGAGQLLPQVLAGAPEIVYWETGEPTALPLG